MSVYTIDKCERFVSQRAGCGKAARPEFCEGCTTVRGAPTRPMKDSTAGESKKLESISIRLSSGIDGSVQYRTYTENEGWEDWSENGEINEKPDRTRRLEAIQIRLTGKAAEKYDIYYRVHCQDYGWLGWGKTKKRPEVKVIRDEWKQLK